MPTLEKIAGVFLIVLGLNLMGVIKIPWLYRTYQLGSGTLGGRSRHAGDGRRRRPAAAATTDGRVAVQSTALSYARSVGFGASFAVAWTPCIGPVLGAILALAGASSTVLPGRLPAAGLLGRAGACRS